MEKGSDSKLRGIKFDTCVHTGDLSLEINKSLSVAPGEGKRPINILSDEKFEELSFPGLFPAGQFGRTHPRPVPLSAKNISSGEFNREVENLHLILSTFLLDNWYHKLRKTFSKFYRRHYELVSKFSVGLKTLLHQGLSEPEFYGDLVYKFKKIVGRADFSDQFRKIIVRYKRIGYNINIMRQSACLVFNPITVNNFASLFNCTPVGRASDSMMAPT